MATTYYVYETTLHDAQIKGLVTSDHVHWWAIDTTLSEAIAQLNSVYGGWTQTDITWRPGQLLYTSETHPELFL